MAFFVALIIFIAGYVVGKWLLEKVPSLVPVAEVLGVVVGALAALYYLKVF